MTKTLDMREDNTTTLTRIHAGHPGWAVRQIAGHAWEAVTRPTATSLHVIVSSTLVNLEQVLDQLQTTPPGARAESGDELQAAVDQVLVERYRGEISPPEAFRRIEALHARHGVRLAEARSAPAQVPRNSQDHQTVQTPQSDTERNDASGRSAGSAQPARRRKRDGATISFSPAARVHRPGLTQAP
jgi:hypothetical protein